MKSVLSSKSTMNTGPRSKGVQILGTLCLSALLWGATPVDSPVADAAMNGNADRVRVLLDQGADANEAQGDGMTALHWAAENGDPAIADLLIQAGADLEATTRIGGYTPLLLASRNGSATVVESLLDAGSDAHATTATGGTTSLHFAAAIGSAQAASALLDHGADVSARESAWGQTPLMFAASAGRVDVLAALLSGGADVGLTTYVESIPDREEVDRAAGRVREEVREAFRAEVAPDGGYWRPAPSQVQAAVHAAQELQRSNSQVSDAPERVIEAGSEEFVGFTGLVGVRGGLTSLLHAVREGHTATAVALLDAGADVNQVSAGDHTSPMLMATINGQFDIALMLLERGADPSLASDAGGTPLFTALNTYWAPKSRYPQQQAYQQQSATYLDVMEAVLEAGADPNVRLTKHLWYMSYTFDLLRVNTGGATTLWRAAYAADVEAMKLLVLYGADPNIATVKPPARRGRGAGPGGRDVGDGAADPSGLPPVPDGGPGAWPIHAAAGVGFGESFAGNAHRHVPDGWLPSIKYLVEELGADVNARDHNGYSAVHHAASRGDNELILYLVEQGADVTFVSRRGQTTIDMANGPQQRVQPFPETIELLESLGAMNNHNCVSC